MFNSSQFLNVFNESDKSDEELDGGERFDRNTIRSEAFGNDDIAGHNEGVVRSLSYNTHTSGADLE